MSFSSWHRSFFIIPGSALFSTEESQGRETMKMGGLKSRSQNGRVVADSPSVDKPGIDEPGVIDRRLTTAVCG